MVDERTKRLKRFVYWADMADNRLAEIASFENRKSSVTRTGVLKFAEL